MIKANFSFPLWGNTPALFECRTSNPFHSKIEFYSLLGDNWSICCVCKCCNFQNLIELSKTVTSTLQRFKISSPILIFLEGNQTNITKQYFLLKFCGNNPHMKKKNGNNLRMGMLIGSLPKNLRRQDFETLQCRCDWCAQLNPIGACGFPDWSLNFQTFNLIQHASELIFLSSDTVYMLKNFTGEMILIALWSLLYL